jgi:glycerophosphoryl diester phosphodiesterase
MPRLARENTLPSFEAALRAGAQGIELDVHVTADGVVVVHHDAATSGGIEIARTSWRELRERAPSGAPAIPTLREVLDLVGGRVELFVEAKGAGVEQPVLDALSEYRGPVAVHGFDHAQIARIGALDSSLRLGILFDEAPADVRESMRATRARDVWPHWGLVTPELVSVVHDAGGRVIPWTVNDRTVAARLAATGVDGICGDDVTLL